MRLCSFLILLALAGPARADSLTLEAVLPQTSSDVPVVAFSPDGKTLFAASYRTTQLSETATWQLRESLPYCAKSFALARDRIHIFDDLGLYLNEHHASRLIQEEPSFWMSRRVLFP